MLLLGCARGKALHIFFPLDAPGVTIQPIAQIDGRTGFAEIMLDEVRVPAFNRLGAEGEGWQICMTTAGFERGLMLRSPARYQTAAARLAALLEQQGPDVTGRIRDGVQRAMMDADAYALSIYHTASLLDAGGKIGAEASINKIFWSELDIALHRTALDLLGPRAPLVGAASSAEVSGAWLDGFFFALAGPIYAGSNEIQKNIIAERVLGLPRN